MNDINEVVIAESPRDVILFATRNKKIISYPALDRLYSRNNWANISNNVELLKLVEAMTLEGLIEHADGGYKNGPNWKEPAFITKKKHPIK